MIKEEIFIKHNFGKANAFDVPEGYFDDVSQKIISKLPNSSFEAEDESKVDTTQSRSWIVRYRLLVGSVAAAVCLFVFSLGAYMHIDHENVKNASGSVQQAQNITSSHHSYSNVDAFVEYSMLDTDDMYALMADAK